MANAAPQLQEAYDLIESGDLQSARQLLEDIRSDNENNPDFWWVYAHAVENESDGLTAIDRVRQLAPNYPGLNDLSQELGISIPPSPIQSLRPPASAPSTDDVEDYYDDAQEDEFDSVPSSGSNHWLMYIGLALVAVVIIILGLIFLTNILTGGGGETPTQVLDATTELASPEPIIPTAISESSTQEVESTDAPLILATDTDESVTEAPTEADESPTEDATETKEATVVPTATDVPPTETEEPTIAPTDTDVPPTETPAPVDPIADLYDDLENAGVPEDGIEIGETDSFGESYIITTCSQPGPVAIQNILQIMDDLASVADDLEAVDGFAFEITDCDTDTVRLTLGFDSDTATDYWSGEIDANELQQSMQRVN